MHVNWTIDTETLLPLSACLGYLTLAVEILSFHDGGGSSLTKNLHQQESTENIAPSTLVRKIEQLIIPSSSYTLPAPKYVKSELANLPYLRAL